MEIKNILTVLGTIICSEHLNLSESSLLTIKKTI
jgi:hypothetical protein